MMFKQEETSHIRDNNGKITKKKKCFSAQFCGCGVENKKYAFVFKKNIMKKRAQADKNIK